MSTNATWRLQRLEKIANFPRGTKITDQQDRATYRKITAEDQQPRFVLESQYSYSPRNRKVYESRPSCDRCVLIFHLDRYRRPPHDFSLGSIAIVPSSDCIIGGKYVKRQGGWKILPRRLPTGNHAHEGEPTKNNFVKDRYTGVNEKKPVQRICGLYDGLGKSQPIQRRARDGTYARVAGRYQTRATLTSACRL